MWTIIEKCKNNLYIENKFTFQFIEKECFFIFIQIYNRDILDKTMEIIEIILIIVNTLGWTTFSEFYEIHKNTVFFLKQNIART